MCNYFNGILIAQSNKRELCFNVKKIVKKPELSHKFLWPKIFW